MKSTKSIKVNMILNTIKGMLKVVFPLITFPYISRILSVENIGKYNYANSIIGYFILFAGLGISTYAIREGAQLREDVEKFNVFANEVFSINVISTIVSYIFLFILIFFTYRLQNYRYLLIILSLQIGFTTIGVEWIFSIYEDYLYITIRSIVFQILSIVLMFALVRNEEDLYRYAFASTVSIIGAGITNYFYSHQFCRLKFIFHLNLKQHIKPILTLFGMAITVTVYVCSDTTILGILCNDHTVGIYSVSAKVYTVLKTILSSILVVSIPRLSAIIGENRNKDFNILAVDIYKTLLTILVPSIVGIAMLRKQVILIISGEKFINATSSLLLLSIALFFCLGAWFWGQCILVPMKDEKVVFIITVISASVNIVLNFILIPIWRENAAALTTIIAEMIAFVLCHYYGKRYIELSGVNITLFKVLTGCLPMVAFSFIFSRILGDGIIYTLVVIIGSIICYFLIEVVLKNEAMNSITDSIKRHLMRWWKCNEINDDRS